MADQQPIIEIKQVWKEYGDNIVLERLNLTVNQGDFVSIVGASGCGKTTFLNMLLGTEHRLEEAYFWMVNLWLKNRVLSAVLYFKSIQCFPI